MIGSAVKVIDTGRKNQQLLIQPQYHPWRVENEIAVIFCGVNGLLENVPIEKVGIFQEQLLQMLQMKYQKEVLDGRDLQCPCHFLHRLDLCVTTHTRH